MIGHRVTVEGDQFLYILGLLADEGLTPEVDYQPAGGNELVIRPAAWDRLGSETQGEVLRFTRDGSPPIAAEGVSGDAEVPPGNAGPAGASAATGDGPDEPEDEPESDPDEPESDAEPGDGTEAPAGPERPPRTGTGSGRKAWAAYAAATGVRVTADMNRDDIIKAVERQETDR